MLQQYDSPRVSGIGFVPSYGKISELSSISGIEFASDRVPSITGIRYALPIGDQA